MAMSEPYMCDICTEQPCALYMYNTVFLTVLHIETLLETVD